MRNATVLTLLGLIAMGLVLTYAFIAGDFTGEGSTLLSLPWGIVSLVDLYVGFALFSGWVVYRETSWPRALLWVAMVMVLGFFAASLYALLALRNSKGSWPHFWMGARTPGAG